jgi:hypothetical protein
LTMRMLPTAWLCHWDLETLILASGSPAVTRVISLILMGIAPDLEMKRAMREFCEDVIHSTKAVTFSELSVII